jgi:hypothetical protein
LLPFLVGAIETAAFARLDVFLGYYNQTTGNNTQLGNRDGERRFAEKGREPSVAVMSIGKEPGGEVMRSRRDVDLALRATGR